MFLEVLLQETVIQKKTLLKLLETAKKKVLDINLRAPHFDRRIVEELLNHTDFLKLNLSELELITGWFSDHTRIEDRLKLVAEKFDISTIVVTMGGDGAILLMNGEMYSHPGFSVIVQDTVGSGDAFLAGLLSKLIENTDPGNALLFANALGALIATKKGACPDYETNEVLELIKENPKAKSSQVL